MEQKRLFIGNLPFAVSEDELGDHFKGVGSVINTKIIKDRETGRSKGFGFVEMDSGAQASKAVEELDGSELGGRPIRVSIAHEKEERPTSSRPRSGSQRDGNRRTQRN